MLSYYVKRSTGEEYEEVKTPPVEGGMWVYGDNVQEQELFELATKHELDHNIVRDVHDKNELPRVEYSKGKTYIFLRMPQLSERGIVKTMPLLAIVDANDFFVVSPYEAALPKDFIASSVPAHGERSAAGLLLGTLAALISSYEELVTHTSSIVKDTGRRLRTHDVTNKDFIHFVTVERNFNEYEMNLDGIRAVTARLRENNHDMLSDEDNEALEDVTLHIQQLLVAIKSYQQSVVSIRNAYSTIANNTLNERMKLLTALTVLVALPNVFYGMFGMNVPIPGHDQEWAFGAIISATMILIVVVYVIAKRFKVF
jgi:magnesium transporter